MALGAADDVVGGALGLVCRSAHDLSPSNWLSMLNEWFSDAKTRRSV
jgi:hypothetical protein